MDVSEAKTSRAKAGLGKFVERRPEAEETERDRGKKGIVGITIRLTHEQWRVINEQALSKGVSMSKLLLQALSKVRQEEGLPPLPSR